MQATTEIRQALQAGQIDLAINLAQTLLHQDETVTEAWFYLGCALQMQEQFAQAEAAFRRVLAGNPGNYAAAENLVQVLFALERFDEAVKVVDPFCLESGPPTAWVWRARSHMASRCWADAVADYQQVLRHSADDLSLQVEYWNAVFSRKDFLSGLIVVSAYAWRSSAFESAVRELAMFMFSGFQWPESRIEALRAKISAAPAEFWPFLQVWGGVHLLNLGLNEFALKLLYSNGNTLQSDLACLAYLAKGDWQHGWPLYQAREHGKAFVNDAVSCGIPEWKGEALVDKSLLIQGEQGVGDMLMALRYLPLLSGQGAHLTIHVRHELLDLLGEGAAQCEAKVAEKGDVPDFQVRLMDLPALVGQTSPFFSEQIPYLKADDTLSREWQGRLPGARVRIGLVWAGNPNHENDIWRSTELADWLSCFSLPGVDWMLLQKGQATVETVWVAGHQNVHDLGPQINTLADTAAILPHLDLLVSVDTSPAHLAGGMGLPVWVLLNACGQDWRWGERDENTAWYPSMTLLRMAHGQSAASYISQTLRPRLIDHLLAVAADRFDPLEKSALLQLRDGHVIADDPCHARVLGLDDNWTHWACEMVKRAPAAMDECAWGRRLAQAGLLWSETHAGYDRQALWQSAVDGVLSPLNFPVLLNLAAKGCGPGLQRFLDVVPEPVLPRLLWSLLQVRQGNAPLDFREVVEDSLTSFPRNPDLLVEYARLCLQDSALFSRAQTAVSRLLLCHPDRAEAWMFAAEILARAGAWEGCEQAMLRASDLGWRDWDLALLEKVCAETGSNPLRRLAESVRAGISATPNVMDASISRYVSNHVRCCNNLPLPALPESSAIPSSVRFGQWWHALALGNWQEGLPLYIEHLRRRHACGEIPVPLAELPTNCLVFQDQGLGDAIMSLRVLRPYLQRSDITLSVWGDLLPLLQAQDWALQRVHKSDFAAQKKAAPAAVSLTELLARCALQLNGPVPMDDPYLIAPAECVSGTAAIFAGELRLRVGLIWAGNRVYVNDAFRSTHLRDWVALAEEDRVRLYSLQKDEPSMEAFYVPELPLEVIAHHLDSFADTAGALTHLDLLITVDSGVAHLAGALGVPVWLLVPAWCTDWRWGYSGDGSAWYPSMRIWRQQKHEAWRDVIARLQVALSELAAAHGGQ